MMVDIHRLSDRDDRWQERKRSEEERRGKGKGDRYKVRAGFLGRNHSCELFTRLVGFSGERQARAIQIREMKLHVSFEICINKMYNMVGLGKRQTLLDRISRRSIFQLPEMRVDKFDSLRTVSIIFHVNIQSSIRSRIEHHIRRRQII